MKGNRITSMVQRFRRSPNQAGGSDTSKRKRRWPMWIALGLVALIVAGLGASYVRREASLPKATMPIAEINGRDTAFDPNVTGKPAVTAQAASAESLAMGYDPGASAPPQQPWDRMIIRTATLQMQVESVAASMDKVRLVAGARGGYVTQSDSRQEGEYLYATLTIQVPAAEFDAAIQELRKLGVKPATENITSSDVTEEFTDLQSQLRNLEQTETRILALMGRAERIEDILNLDRELRNIRGEIERIQGRVSYLSKRAEMSTITVSLSPEIAPVKPTTLTTNGWDPSEIVLRAWNASLDLLAGVANVLLTGAVFLWWALPLLLVGWLIFRPRRRATSANPPAEA